MTAPPRNQTTDARARDVLDFWFGTGSLYGTARSEWFVKNAAFDDVIRARFFALYEEAAARRLDAWMACASECLALIVVLDQFPRNMFRGLARAFAADTLALEAARHALAQGYDRGLRPVERLFVYLPFEHSESLEDQRRCCELTRGLASFPETSQTHQWALKHLEIIERFGRFPHRNAALDRPSTTEEIEFLRHPGSGF